MSDSEHTIVAGLLQKPSRIVEVAVLNPKFLQDNKARALLTFQVKYWQARHRKNAMDLALARTLFERSNAEAAEPLLELVAEYESFDTITDPEFRDSVLSLLTARQQQLIRQHGKKALEAILDKDWELAQHMMRKGLAAVDDVDLQDDSPEDIRSAEVTGAEGDIIESPARARRIFDIGFARIRKRVSVATQELSIVAGFTGDGKTHLAKTFCYNANQQGANVLFVALEMSKREMRVMFVCNHAATIDRRGCNWVDILDGRASRRERALYKKALADYSIEEHEDGDEIKTPGGGKLFIWAPRKKVGWSKLADRVRSLDHDVGLDVAVADYLELIRPDRDLGQYRLNLKDMVEEGKSLARELNLWMIINHQISRKGRDEAEKRRPHFYRLADLGESSGIEKSADTVFWIYSDEDTKEDREARVGIIKARKGDTLIRGFPVVADFPKAVIAQKLEDEEE